MKTREEITTKIDSLFEEWKTVKARFPELREQITEYQRINAMVDALQWVIGLQSKL